MSTLSHFLGLLKDHRQQYAIEALSQSPAKDPSYAFGEAVGYLKGLAKAEQIFNEVLKGEEKDGPETYVGKLRRSTG